MAAEIFWEIPWCCHEVLWLSNCSSTDPNIRHPWVQLYSLPHYHQIIRQMFFCNLFICIPCYVAFNCVRILWSSKQSDRPVCGITCVFLLFLMQVHSNSFERQPSVRAFRPLFFCLLMHYQPESKKAVETNIWKHESRGPKKTHRHLNLLNSGRRGRPSILRKHNH